MAKIKCGKLIGGAGLFTGGALIGAIIQNEVQCYRDRKRLDKKAADDRLENIEWRLKIAEDNVRDRDKQIYELKERIRAMENAEN